jgi:hypothetical protein
MSSIKQTTGKKANAGHIMKTCILAAFADSKGLQFMSVRNMSNPVIAADEEIMTVFNKKRRH